MLWRYAGRRRTRVLTPRDPIPSIVREHVRARDRGCVFGRLGIAHDCFGGLEIDHVRASGGLGIRSRGTPDNLVLLCPTAHLEKTLHRRRWRPVLLAWIDRAEREAE